MIKIIEKWWVRCFCLITIEKAKELNLKWHCNIYGDMINKFDCRSIWVDDKGKFYRRSVLKGIGA